jgi:hypothetical protein
MTEELCLLKLREAKVVQGRRTWGFWLEVVKIIVTIFFIYKTGYKKVIGDKLYNFLPNI